jgi:uncharacterized protein (DUF1330 family)
MGRDREEFMQTRYIVMFTMLAGIGTGAAVVHGLHAQAKPPVYYISEIEVTNLDAYMNEYVPKTQAVIQAAGGRVVAAGQPVAIEGDPPASRVVVQVWRSMEELQAWRDSDARKAIRPIGEKYAKFRSFAVEGLSQELQP